MAASKTTPIELIDGAAFYDKLKIAQVRDTYFKDMPFEISNQTVPQLHYYGYDTPCNSL